MAERKVMLVTGAAHGIGAAIARLAAAQGWRVVALDRDVPDRAAFDLVRHDQADVADETEVIGAVNRLREREGRLDALVCNAGIMERTPLAGTTLAAWRAVLDTNLTAAFLLARACEDLLRDRHGAIVTIASTRAHMSEPDTFAYSASKGGLVALTHALAVSLGPAIRANCVSPGWIATGSDTLRPTDHAQHPTGRVGRPEDVAELVLFLCDGTRAGFATGAEFVLDGGMTHKMIYAE